MKNQKSELQDITENFKNSKLKKTEINIKWKRTKMC